MTSILKPEYILLLEGSSNFALWKQRLTQLLQDAGYWGHVEGSRDPHAIYPAAYPPAACTRASTPEQVSAYRAWWQKDNKVRGVVMRHLSVTICSLLDAREGVSARDIWKTLDERYNRLDVPAQFRLKEKLQDLRLKDQHGLELFLNEFKAAREGLIAMGAPCAEIDLALSLYRGLPRDGTWQTFRQTAMLGVQDRVDRSRARAHDPVALVDWLVKRITAECLHLQSEKPAESNVQCRVHGHYDYAKCAYEYKRVVSYVRRTPVVLRPDTCVARNTSHSCALVSRVETRRYY